MAGAQQRGEASSLRKEVKDVLQKFSKSKHEFEAKEELIENVRNRLKIMVNRALNAIHAKEEEEIKKIKNKARLLRDQVTEIRKKRNDEFVKVQTNNKEKMKRAEKIQTKLTQFMEQADDSKPLGPNVMNDLKFQRDLQFEEVDHGKSFIGFKSQDVVNNYDLGEILQENWELKTTICEVEQGNLNCATGVGCFSNGDIAVNDTKNERLSVFTSTGQYKEQYDLNAPYGIAVTSDDRLLAQFEDGVDVFDTSHRPKPELIRQLTLPQQTKGVLAGCITVDNSNQVAVVDEKTGVTYLFNLDDSSIKVIPNTKMVPIDIATNNKGCLIFAMYDKGELRCVELTGKELFNVSTSVDGKDAKPTGVCCDDAGDIYAALHCGKGAGTGEVRHYDSHGVYLHCVAKELWCPFGIAFNSPSGELVVADKLSVKIFQEFCPEYGTFKCNVKKCKVCKTHIRQSSTFSGYSSNTIHKTIGLITCTTSNVIYLITCKVCKEQYVGETIQTLKERFGDHQSYVRTKKLNYPTGKHFNLPGHSITDMILQGIECVPDDPVRKSKEQEWMDRLRTKVPNGLNIR